MKKLLFLILLLNTLNTRAQQKQVYAERIATLNRAIDSCLTDKPAKLFYETTDPAVNENKHSWLWPLCALLQAANEEDTLHPAQHRMQQVETAVDQYYSDKNNLPAYQDYVTRERASSRFYDDNQWLAIAYLDVFNRTHQHKYLDRALMINRFMMSGLDTVAGGGFYWKEGDHTTKNTCSNGPGILILLQMYRITHQHQYLDTALAVYAWANKYLQAGDGTYYDHIKLPSLHIGKAIYTYNTGTMLQANALLYLITKDKAYLDEAQRIARNGRARFFKNGRLPNGNYWFNAVMLRGYVELYQIDKNAEWINFWREDADRIWKEERNPATNLVGPKPVKRLIDQAAMLEIYARLQQLSELK